MCANKTSASVLSVLPATAGWQWPAFIQAMIDMVEFLPEALEMRREAQRRYFLGDE